MSMNERNAIILDRWAAAPEWAQWLAADSDGSWWWYENQPILGRRGWVGDPTDNGKRRRADLPPVLYAGDAGWIYTLARRPDDRKPTTRHPLTVLEKNLGEIATLTKRLAELLVERRRLKDVEVNIEAVVRRLRSLGMQVEISGMGRTSHEDS